MQRWHNPLGAWSSVTINILLGKPRLPHQAANAQEKVLRSTHQQKRWPMTTSVSFVPLSMSPLIACASMNRIHLYDYTCPQKHYQQPTREYRIVCLVEHKRTPSSQHPVQLNILFRILNIIAINWCSHRLTMSAVRDVYHSVLCPMCFAADPFE